MQKIGYNPFKFRFERKDNRDGTLTFTTYLKVGKGGDTFTYTTTVSRDEVRKSGAEEDILVNIKIDHFNKFLGLMQRAGVRQLHLGNDAQDVVEGEVDGRNVV